MTENKPNPVELTLTTGELVPGTWKIVFDKWDVWCHFMCPNGCIWKEDVTRHFPAALYLRCSYRENCDCNEDHWAILKA